MTHLITTASIATVPIVTVPTAIEKAPSAALPPARHLVHSGGCPLYVWWALAKRRNRAGQQWLCYFVYLEYRLVSGASAYVQHELRLDKVDDAIWRELAQLPIPGACALASREQLIQGD